MLGCSLQKERARVYWDCFLFVFVFCGLLCFLNCFFVHRRVVVPLVFSLSIFVDYFSCARVVVGLTAEAHEFMAHDRLVLYLITSELSHTFIVSIVYRIQIYGIYFFVLFVLTSRAHSRRT